MSFAPHVPCPLQPFGQYANTAVRKIARKIATSMRMKMRSSVSLLYGLSSLNLESKTKEVAVILRNDRKPFHGSVESVGS